MNLKKLFKNTYYGKKYIYIIYYE